MTSDLAAPTQNTSRRRLRWAWALIVVLFAASVGLGIYGMSQVTVEAEADTVRHALEEAQPFNDPQAEPVVVPESEISDLEPNLVYAPDVDLRAPLVPMGLDDREDIAIPWDASEAALFTGSMPLDSSVGSTLIAGHVAYSARGDFAPMAQLAQLRPGDLVITVDHNGVRSDWRVVSAEVVPRDGLREDMWAADGQRQLVLITCAGRTGEIEAGTVFTDNLVVTAYPVVAQ